MQLDSRTATLMGMAAAMLFSLLGVLIGSGRRSCPGFHYWTIANLCAALSLLLIGLRGIIPEPVSVVAGNLIGVMACSLVVEGARRFRGITRIWRPVPVAGAVTLAVIFYLRFGVNDLSARVVVLSLYLGIFGIAGATQFFLAIRPGYRLSLGFTASSLLLVATIHLVRVYFAHGQPPMSSLYAPSLAFSIFMIVTVLGIISWSFGFFLINHDHLVEHLKEAQSRAAHADSAKSQFLANASHEIRTPMNGVISLTELLLDTPLDVTQRDYVETVRESGLALLEIINELLDLSKIEAGRLELVETAFDVREVIEKTVDLLFWKAESKGLKLVWEVDPEVSRSLLGDAGRLRQVLTNLAGNSIKFTNRGEIAIRVAADGAMLRFSVTDTGPGIPKEEQTKLFGRFEQMENGRHNGTGLGLAISKELAQRMGGRIGVISEPGQGATFWFTAALKKNPSFEEALISDNSPYMHR
ncbi:MAG: ATP-binding protein [Bryobacteraceae bacterium]